MTAAERAKESLLRWQAKRLELAQKHEECREACRKAEYELCSAELEIRVWQDRLAKIEAGVFDA